MGGSRLRLAAAVAAGLVVVAAGCGGDPVGQGRASFSPTVVTPAPQRAAKGLDAVRRFRSVRGYRPTPVPVRLEIPRIGVATGLQRLGRDGDGSVAVPSRWEVAGWYAQGPRPGEPGSTGSPAATRRASPPTTSSTPPCGRSCAWSPAAARSTRSAATTVRT
jgi:hypothetical protein